MSQLVFPERLNDAPPNNDFIVRFGGEVRVIWIGGAEDRYAFGFVEPLDQKLFVDRNNHDVTVARFFGTIYNQQVAVEDPRFNQFLRLLHPNLATSL